MAEALAITASVVAIIQITDRIIGLCKFYIETARDAPSDLRVILTETSALKIILENLNFLNACDGSVAAATRCMSSAYGPIEGCLRTAAELEKLFPSDAARPTTGKSSKRQKFDSALTVLAWPLKESKARKLLDEMMRYKTTISLALTANSAQDIREIKDKTSKIYVMLTESQSREVYRWLQHTDPSPIHNRAQKDYEPGTGNWILRTPEWADWLAGKHRSLWIHGIPGAGKTVLMSHMIEQIKQHCDQIPERKSIYIFYYCYFAHNQDETKPFLKWLIGRLCREAGGIPTYVSDLNSHGEDPSLIALLESVARLLDLFETVYVAVDAIDESHSSDGLLESLQTLGTDRKFKNLRLITSSRDYVNIERVMTSFSVSIPMDNPLVQGDIGLYVGSRLHSNPHFAIWPPDLLHEVERGITIGARGMFRWAVCQIFAIQRLKCERKTVQRALQNLPKTLDETYDRILSAIPEEDRLFVDYSLQWIAKHNETFNGRGIPLEVLIEAAEASILNHTGTRNERFYDKDMLREVCGCLIDISNEDSFDQIIKTEYPYMSVKFAHYSVREYLDSNRTMVPVFGHRIRGEKPKDRLLQITLSGAMCVEPTDSGDLKIDFTDDTDVVRAVTSKFDVYCVLLALLSLHKFPDRICQENTLKALAIDLLDPSAPHYPAMEDAATGIERATNCFWAVNPHNEAFFWSIAWHPEPETELKHLYNLLLLTEFNPTCLLLTETFLQGKDLVSLLRAQVSFSRDVWEVRFEDGYETCTFKGSCVEIFAQLAARSVHAFKFLLEVGAGSFDPSIVLLLYIGGHDHSTQVDCIDFCPVQRLLELGADRNLRVYRITPLQIATCCMDRDGVEQLLKAGALPNDSGSPDGIIWEEDSILHHFNHLHRVSPLKICRELTINRAYSAQAIADARKKIEELLLRYGAEAFSTERGA